MILRSPLKMPGGFRKNPLRKLVGASSLVFTVSIVFSSEVDTGSREENVSKKGRASVLI
jgi:hypothetical protein